MRFADVCGFPFLPQKFPLRDCALAFESLSQEFEDGARDDSRTPPFARLPALHPPRLTDATTFPPAVFFHCDQLIKSMHSVFMADWLGAYPRDDILVLRLEDYRDPQKRRSTLQQVFRCALVEKPSGRPGWKCTWAPPRLAYSIFGSSLRRHACARARGDAGGTDLDDWLSSPCRVARCVTCSAATSCYRSRRRTSGARSWRSPSRASARARRR